LLHLIDEIKELGFVYRPSQNSNYDKTLRLFNNETEACTLFRKYLLTILKKISTNFKDKQFGTHSNSLHIYLDDKSIFSAEPKIKSETCFFNFEVKAKVLEKYPLLKGMMDKEYVEKRRETRWLAVDMKKTSKIKNAIEDFSKALSLPIDSEIKNEKTSLISNSQLLDLSNKPNMQQWFNEHPNSTKRVLGVVEYLMSHFDMDNGSCVVHDYKDKPQFIFNSSKADKYTVRVFPRIDFVTVTFAGPPSWIEKHNAKEFQGNRGGNPDAEVSKNYRVDFRIRTTDDFKDIETFLNHGDVANFNIKNKSIWIDTFDWSGFNEKLKQTIYTQEVSERLITQYEQLLGNHFGYWLSTQINEVKNIIREDKADKITREQVDFSFKLKGAFIAAELKSTRNGAVTVKSCIRNAIAQLLEYALYRDDNGYEQLWIVVDKKPNKVDVDYIKTLKKKYNIPLKIVYFDGNKFI